MVIIIKEKVTIFNLKLVNRSQKYKNGLLSSQFEKSEKNQNRKQLKKSAFPFVM